MKLRVRKSDGSSTILTFEDPDKISLLDFFAKAEGIQHDTEKAFEYKVRSGFPPTELTNVSLRDPISSIFKSGDSLTIVHKSQKTTGQQQSVGSGRGNIEKHPTSKKPGNSVHTHRQSIPRNDDNDEDYQENFVSGSRRILPKRRARELAEDVIHEDIEAIQQMEREANQNRNRPRKISKSIKYQGNIASFKTVSSASYSTDASRKRSSASKRVRGIRSSDIPQNFEKWMETLAGSMRHGNKVSNGSLRIPGPLGNMMRVSTKGAVTKQYEVALGSRRYAASLARNVKFTPFKNDQGIETQVWVQFKGGTRKWEQELMPNIPRNALVATLRHVYTDLGDSGRESLKPHVMCLVAPRMFWALYRHSDVPINQALEHILPDLNWDFLQKRARKLTSKAHETLQQKQQYQKETDTKNNMLQQQYRKLSTQEKDEIELTGIITKFLCNLSQNTDTQNSQQTKIGMNTVIHQMINFFSVRPSSNTSEPDHRNGPPPEDTVVVFCDECHKARFITSKVANELPDDDPWYCNMLPATHFPLSTEMIVGTKRAISPSTVDLNTNPTQCEWPDDELVDCTSDFSSCFLQVLNISSRKQLACVSLAEECNEFYNMVTDKQSLCNVSMNDIVKCIHVEKKMDKNSSHQSDLLNLLTNKLPIVLAATYVAVFAGVFESTQSFTRLTRTKGTKNMCSNEFDFDWDLISRIVLRLLFGLCVVPSSYQVSHICLHEQLSLLAHEDPPKSSNIKYHLNHTFTRNNILESEKISSLSVLYQLAESWVTAAITSETSEEMMNIIPDVAVRTTLSTIFNIDTPRDLVTFQPELLFRELNAAGVTLQPAPVENQSNIDRTPICESDVKQWISVAHQSMKDSPWLL